MNSNPEISSTRRVIAVTLGVIALFCTLLWLLTNAFVVAQQIAGVYDGPMLIVVAFVLTFPPLILCTIFALMLVGPRRCKLAWISLLIYLLPFTVLFCAIAFQAISHWTGGAQNAVTVFP